MASKDEEFETGIEATDLASLLCRFEEATSSVDDLNLYVKEKNRDKLIKVGISRMISDSEFSSVMPLNISGVTNKRKTNEVLHFASQVITNDISSDPAVSKSHGTESICLGSELAPIQIHDSELIVDSHLMVESWSNRKIEETFEKSRNTVIFEPHNQDCSTDLSSKKELVLQNTSSQFCSLTNVNHQKYELSLPLTTSAKHSHEIHTKVFATTDALRVDDTPVLSNELIQLFPENHKTVFCSDTAVNETQKLTSNVRDSNSGICIELLSGAGNCKFDEVLNCSLERSEIFSGLDHSYCSNNLLPALKLPDTGCSHTFVSNILQQEGSLALEASELYQGITDSLCEHLSSKSADKSILEEREIFVDSNGNDLFLHDASHPSDAIKHEAIVATEKKESRKRPYSCLHHTESNTGSNCDENIFFDKIPSYYTVLSIPSRPVATTVFASTTKAFGATDHLDLLDSSGPFDEGHYDKVPAHRRCFTNTAKEVEITFESSEVQNSVSSCMPMQATFHNYSHKVDNLALPFQSVQSCVGNLAVSDVKHTNRSQSPYKSPGRHSRSMTRHHSSASKFSRRSASSLSDCSTCSSCSDCSTCSVLSRSPSSSSSERGSSRSSSSDSSTSSRYSGRTDHHLTPSKVKQSRSRTASPEEPGWRSKRYTYRNKHSFSAEVKISEKRKLREQEQVKAMEERRIVYVGKIPDGYTKKQLYQRFQSFGEIRDVKVNFREHGDNYGFVTYAYACDAIAAKEKGNSIPGAVKFDLCFGGRRHFCSDQYSDLDGNREIEEEYAPLSKSVTHELDFDALLKQHSTCQKRKI